MALKGQRSGSGGQQPAPESIEFVKPSVPVATKRKNREVSICMVRFLLKYIFFFDLLRSQGY